MSLTRKISSLVFVLLLASGALLAQSVDVPLSNWTVPPYLNSSSHGITTMTDVTNALPFVGVQPCRIADTRGGAPITGGAFTASEARNWTVAGVCGIPSFVQAISVNVTVVAAGGIPNGSFLLAWPTGTPPVQTTALITFGPGQIISNAAIIPVSSPGGQITVNVSAPTHVIMDVNGYFPVVFNAGTSVDMEGNVASGNMMFVGNFAGSGAGTHGIYGYVGNESTNSAGVLGRTGFVTPLDGYTAAGVRGEGASGVLGISGNFLGGGEAVSASLVDGFGHEIKFAGLATSFGSDSPGAAPWAVFGGGDIGATGTKYFLDPHPTNPKLAIGYVSLEGPEAGTYFRGRARFQNGTARIAVPEHFRLVTDPEGLTVQITPIGAMATFAVMKMDLNEIVVQASRNVEFSYLVQGVRATYKDINPIRGSGAFMPRSAEAKLPLWLSPAQKQSLIRNGTYHEDGTINVETAKTLGWDKIWEARSQPRPQPQPAQQP